MLALAPALAIYHAAEIHKPSECGVKGSAKRIPRHPARQHSLFAPLGSSQALKKVDAWAQPDQPLRAGFLVEVH